MAAETEIGRIRRRCTQIEAALGFARCSIEGPDAFRRVTVRCEMTLAPSFRL